MASELEGAISFGDPDEVMGVIGRLVTLPEFGQVDEIERIREQFEEAAKIEKQAKAARRRARQMAERLVRRCIRKWSDEEVYEATGYNNPED